MEPLGNVLPECHVFIKPLTGTQWEVRTIDYNPLYIGECMRRNDLTVAKVKTIFGIEYWRFVAEGKPAIQTDGGTYARSRVGKPSPAPTPRKPSPPSKSKKIPAKKTTPRKRTPKLTGDAAWEYEMYHPTPTASPCQVKVWIDRKETTLSGLYIPESIASLILKGAPKTAWVKHAGAWEKWGLTPDKSAKLIQAQAKK